MKVLTDSGTGFTSWIICGIDRVTAMNTDASPDNNIEVANMSLGGSGGDSTCNSFFDSYHKAICKSTKAGVTYAVAAGNSNKDLKDSRPATYDQVLAVTAVSDFNGVPGGGATATCRDDFDDTSADFSNFTTEVSSNSILLAFVFSAVVGIVFGLLPANRAARLEPVEALRYE